jgi:hypothetical protein
LEVCRKEIFAFTLSTDKYVWITPDSVAQDQVVTSDVKEYSKGLLGTRPIVGTGPLFDQFKSTWAALDPAQYSGSGTSKFNDKDSYVYDSVLAYAWAIQGLIDAGMASLSTIVLT